MGPVEFRVSFVPDDREEFGYNVTVWMRRFDANPDNTGWGVVQTKHIAGSPRPGRPRELLSWLMRCLALAR